ncbi:MAG: DUF308 domain-containing protein [Anaerolineae bacterium]
MATAAAPTGTALGASRRPWWMTLIMGIASVVFGGLLLFGSFTTQVRTYELLIALLGIWWVIDGIVDIVHIFHDRTRWGWNLFIGIISIIAGTWILFYPAYAGVALPKIFVLMLGVYGVIEGIVLLLVAFRGGGWGAGILGVIALILGIVLMANWANPGWGLSLIWVGALFAFIGGFVMIWRSFVDRRTESV